MIAILVDDYDDAVEYVQLLAHEEPVFTICKYPVEVPQTVNAIVYLGGSEELREIALRALEI